MLRSRILAYANMHDRQLQTYIYAGLMYAAYPLCMLQHM
jgi:hypothetical protein